MDFYKLIGTALVVGVIGPLFWLGVGLLKNRIESFVRKLTASQKAAAAANKAKQ